MKIKLTIALGIVAATATSCIDKEWVLGKVDTDNIVIADTLVAPLGYVSMTADYVLGGAVSGVEIGDPVIDHTFTYHMNTTLDATIVNALVGTGGNLTIMVDTNNNFPMDLAIESAYIAEDLSSVIIPEYSVPARSKAHAEMDVTVDEFKAMVEAEDLAINVRRTDSGNITIASGDHIIVTFSIRKTGGIKPSSIF